MAFTKGSSGAGKPDARGTVRVKIILQDPRKFDGQPVTGNRKEEFTVDGATVGEVYDAVHRALFEPNESSGAI